MANLTSLFTAAILFLLFPAHALAAVYRYEALTTPPVEPLAYGEPISIIGALSDVTIRGHLE